MQRKYQIIKKITEWPLSKVELVSVEDKNYILKTIHKDFVDEISRQKILYKRLKQIKVPKIYDHWQEKNKVLFLMEYISDAKNDIDDRQALKIINDLHLETLDFEQKSFPRYTHRNFLEDLETTKKYTEKALSDFPIIEKKVKQLFDQDYSVVHGDWDKRQILIYQGQTYVIDFGRSFYGPPILDFAYYARKHPDANNLILKITKITPKELLLAKFIVGVMQIKWFDLCRKKYIDYNYSKEINEAIEYGFIEIFKNLK